MKILDIQLNKDTATVMTLSSGTILKSVILTVKRNWFSKPEKIIAFPTNYGPTYGWKNILFNYYCDEKGKEFSDDISRQINNFVLASRVNETEPEQAQVSINNNNN